MGRPVANHKVLTRLLWPWQQVQPPQPLRVSDPEQYFWRLECNVHVKLCSAEAVVKQMTEHECLSCDRCNKSVHSAHRSKYEAYAWDLLECTLDQATVCEFMYEGSDSLYGKCLGFVVEAKVLRKRFGAADIYIPALDLIIQVDGQHHDSPTQMGKDARFDAEAHGQGRALLRLHHLDECAFHKAIPKAVQLCMERCQPTTGLVMYTDSHPQSSRPAGSVTMT
jgi:hypothetical protein